MADETNGTTDEPNGKMSVADLKEQIDLQTAFTRDMLRFISDGDDYSGSEIKENMVPVYEVNHGRLYPNLDRLVEGGLVEKGQRDRRTNTYEITPKGLQFITYVNEELGR